MTILPARIKDFVVAGSIVKMLDDHGALVRHLESGEVLELARAGAVVGRSREGTLRHVVAVVSAEEIDTALNAPRARRISLTSAASQTTYRETIVVTAPRRLLPDGSFTQSGTFTIFQHKAGRMNTDNVIGAWFGPQERQRREDVHCAEMRAESPERSREYRGGGGDLPAFGSRLAAAEEGAPVSDDYGEESGPEVAPNQ
jgi:hypothetical protein